MNENHIRLGCHNCDREDFDGIEELPTDWVDVQEFQGLDASRKEVSADGNGSPFDWQTHLGTCPDCQQEEQRHGS